MTEILMYLATRCGFLFRPKGFRFVDSLVDESFGGDAMVVLESDTTRLRVTNDRQQLLLAFQPLAGNRQEWFSPGLLRGLLLGERGGSEVLDDDWSEFLRFAVPELEERLGDPPRAAATVHELRVQATHRAKELFG